MTTGEAVIQRKGALGARLGRESEYTAGQTTSLETALNEMAANHKNPAAARNLDRELLSFAGRQKHA